MHKAIFNWSGGKDSSLALHKIIQQNDYDIQVLLTSVSQQYKRVSMHGVRVELLEAQAESIGIPLQKLWMPEAASMEEYNRIMADTMEQARDNEITRSIFGDIFLEDLKKYREDQLAKVNMKGVFPLWKLDTRMLLEEFIDLGFKAVLVCVNEKYLDKSFAGRMLDKDFLNDLPANVDPCGENGEYHSFVFDGPIFKKPINFQIGEVVHRTYPSASGPAVNYDTGFYYCDLIV
jgi:uncharacterized protein (TIGR00290 family)